MAATKLDAAIVTRDTWRVELLTLEAGQKDSIEGQSKLLSDRYKLAKGLKDQIDFIYKWLPTSQKYRITEVEVFGILISGTSVFISVSKISRRYHSLSLL